MLKYFSLPFTLFEPCGAVFIMLKDTFEENSLNEHFKTISHYFRVKSLSCFIIIEAARSR